jgi:hypothetical protein
MMIIAQYITGNDSSPIVPMLVFYPSKIVYVQLMHAIRISLH